MSAATGMVLPAPCSYHVPTAFNRISFQEAKKVAEEVKRMELSPSNVVRRSPSLSRTQEYKFALPIFFDLWGDQCLS